MKFSIITPTHKRADKLARAVRSVQAQTYTDWEMIIVNDSPSDRNYLEFTSSINDSRIRYLTNERNMGVNFSRNRALGAVSAASDWVVFLDDDDYLAPDALMTFRELIQQHHDKKWFITNRAHKNGRPATSAPKSNRTYSYAKDYLLLRKIKGDATHIINTRHLHGIQFSQHIKQGEEWIFFYQLGLTEKIFYHDHNSTITDGYNNEQGLNFRKRSRTERLEAIATLLYEGIRRRFWYQPTFLLYLFARFLKAIVQNSN